MLKSEESGLSEITVEKLVSIFQKFHRIKEVTLYGSRAKGTFQVNSDIDLTLIGKDLTTTDLLAIQNQIDDLLLPYQVDLSLYSHIDNDDLLTHIQKVGKTFYSTTNC